MKKSNSSQMLLATILLISVMFLVFVVVLTDLSRQEKLTKNVLQLQKEAFSDSILQILLESLDDSLINTSGMSKHFFSMSSYLEKVTGRRGALGRLLILKGMNYGLSEATISFNTPETMKVAETKTVILLMSQQESILQLDSLIKKQVSEPSKIHSDTVKISTIMEASLTGQGFLIDAITPVRQLVDGFDRNTWKWEITAKETGEKKLHLTLNALISNGKNKELHTIKTYERTVLVYVRFGDRLLAFLGGNWQFLFGAIVSPLVIYFWKRIVGHKKDV